MMPLTKTDLKDAKMLLKAGNIDATRRILSNSNDPRAMQLLAKLDAHFPAESDLDDAPSTDLNQIKHLIMQKKFDAAEALLRASDHPDANRILKKLEVIKAKSASKSSSQSKLRPRVGALWRYIAVTVYGFLSSSN